MSRDPRYDILFEPVKIGPVTARNRFYQVPHCNGMGTVHPSSMAPMRGVKAEGGWAVICTDECDFHHTGDITPAIEARLWSDQDIPIMARMVEAGEDARGALHPGDGPRVSRPGVDLIIDHMPVAETNDA